MSFRPVAELMGIHHGRMGSSDQIKDDLGGLNAIPDMHVALRRLWMTLSVLCMLCIDVLWKVTFAIEAIGHHEISGRSRIHGSDPVRHPMSTLAVKSSRYK